MLLTDPTSLTRNRSELAIADFDAISLKYNSLENI